MMLLALLRLRKFEWVWTVVATDFGVMWYGEGER